MEEEGVELIYLMMAFHFASTICLVFGFLIFTRDLFDKRDRNAAKCNPSPPLKDEKEVSQERSKRKPVVIDDEKAFHMQREEISRRRPMI